MSKQKGDGVRPLTATETDEVLDDVYRERARQDAKWGIQNHDAFRWVAILGEEYGEVCRAACENWHGVSDEQARQYREELVQVAAVAVAMIESLDRVGFCGATE
jgi:hypothetical protein